MSFIPAVLVYVRRGDEVLLMRRRKEPNLGLWIAPGGKVEPDESPYDAARRELREETGLTAGRLTLRGLITEISPYPHWRWMLFVFVTDDAQGEVDFRCDEGDLAWVKVDAYLNDALPIPQADAIFAPHILRTPDGLLQAKFVYDAELRLAQWVIY